MFDPDTLRRPKIRPKEESASGFGGAPTSVRFPSRRSRLRYWLMSCSAETVSRMKSKLPACFCISSALGVAAVGDAAKVSVPGIVGEGNVSAVLLNHVSGSTRGLSGSQSEPGEALPESPLEA